MMRGLLLALGLIIGLALSALFGGTMAHLRMLAPLPGWTEGIEGDARLTAGQGQVNGAILRWHIAGAAGLSATFAVTVSGADWQLEGQARPGLAGIELSGISGLVPLAWLGAGEGDMAITGGVLSLAWDGSVEAAEMRGRQTGGPITLRWQDGWVVEPR